MQSYQHLLLTNLATVNHAQLNRGTALELRKTAARRAFAHALARLKLLLTACGIHTIQIAPNLLTYINKSNGLRLADIIITTGSSTSRNSILPFV